MTELALACGAQWLDNLEKTDPEGYKQFIATMQSQLQAAGLGPEHGEVLRKVARMRRCSTCSRALQVHGEEPQTPIRQVRPTAGREREQPGAITHLRVVVYWAINGGGRFQAAVPWGQGHGEDGLKATPEGVRDKLFGGYWGRRNSQETHIWQLVVGRCTSM